MFAISLFRLLPFYKTPTVSWWYENSQVGAGFGAERFRFVCETEGEALAKLEYCKLWAARRYRECVVKVEKI